MVDAGAPDAPNRRRRVVAARLLAAVLVACTAAAFLARWSWTGELLASFRPHLLVACVLGALAALVLRRPLPALALGVAAAANLLPMLPVLRDQPEPPEPGAPTLTVAHHNAQGGFGETVEVLQRLDEDPVDVLVVFAPAPDWAAFLRPELPALGYELVLPTAGLAEQDVMVISRVPTAEVRLATAEGLPPESVGLSVELGGEAVRLLATHTRNPLTPIRWRERDRQLRAIAAWVQDEVDGGAQVALFGDLNVAPWSPTFGWFERQTGLVSSADGQGVQISWPLASRLGRAAGVPIDHLLHTDGLTTVERRVAPSLGSEHGVLVVELAPAAGP